MSFTNQVLGCIRKVNSYRMGCFLIYSYSDRFMWLFLFPLVFSVFGVAKLGMPIRCLSGAPFSTLSLLIGLPTLIDGSFCGSSVKGFKRDTRKSRMHSYAKPMKEEERKIKKKEERRAYTPTITYLYVSKAYSTISYVPSDWSCVTITRFLIFLSPYSSILSW